MKPDNCLALLATVLDAASVAVPEQSALFKSGRSVLVMARAYESDGRTFFASDDQVNALASAWYGFGWFHFGITDGLLKCTMPAGCPFSSPCEPLLPQFRDRLNEKSGRYKNLLDIAWHAVRPAPESGTSAGEFADRVQLIVSVYSGGGNCHYANGAYEDALACFSYAHGWLDAGVTAGLFVITDHHELFTV